MIICALFVSLCFVSINSIDAATVTVNPGSSIQSAVNNANAGDTVVVNDNKKQAYTYKESITLNKKVNIISNGHVTIKAKNTDSAVFTINPQAAGSSIKNFKLSDSSYCIMVCASNCVISGNTITKSSLVGIQFYGDISHSTVNNNHIVGVSPKWGNGISFEYGKATYNSIRYNGISNYLNGILFNSYSAYNVISKNRVANTGYTGAGIYTVDNSKYNQITYNKVTGCEDGIAVQKMGSGIATFYTLKGNVVEYNKNGFWIRLSNSIVSNNIAKYNRVSGIDLTGKRNNVVSNLASGNGICGITIGKYSSADYNLVQKNTLTYNKAGMNSGSSYTTICDNIVQHNRTNGIISLANHVTIRNNSVSSSPNRILVQGSSNTVK